MIEGNFDARDRSDHACCGMANKVARRDPVEHQILHELLRAHMNVPRFRKDQLRQLHLDLSALLNRNLEPKVTGLRSDAFPEFNCSELSHLISKGWYKDGAKKY